MKSLVLTLSLVLVAGITLAAEGDKPGKGKGGAAPDPAKRAQQMMKTLDKDSDGKISKEEFAAGPAAKRANGDQSKIDKAFSRLDSDGDGSITKEEIEKAPAPGKGPKKPKGSN
ncbi:MAG: EF-hand domain-containing protein [Verrucomicrobiae bacterium]|nr:EF-hand domain-containing protein [Verrucomicrobiae bacterium]